MSRLHRGIGLTRRQAIKLGGGAALVSALPLRPALAADKVIFRTNWLFYGSHSIFFLGIDKGYYAQDNLDVVVKQGNGSGATTRLVANKDSTFAYCSAVTMMKLAAQSAPVQSYLQGLAPAILGGIDDKPAEIEANGGKTPIAFNYADYGVYQPGYAIVAHRDTVKDNPDLVKRFVHATLEAVKEAAANPDEAINSLINWEA